MKKIVILLVLAAVIAGGAFAEMSAGGGLYFASDFGGGYRWTRTFTTLPDDNYDWKMPYVAFGLFGFFEPIQYVEINAGVFLGFSTWDVTYDDGTFNSLDSHSTTDLAYSGLDLGVLGKFPIKLGDKLVVYPALGVNFSLFYYAMATGSSTVYDADTLSALWFKLGGGLDAPLSEKVFLRANILYGIRLSNKFEDDYVSANNTYSNRKAEPLLGHGLTIRVGVGFKL